MTSAEIWITTQMDDQEPGWADSYSINDVAPTFTLDDIRRIQEDARRDVVGALQHIRDIAADMID